MGVTQRTREELEAEAAQLRARLQEAQRTLRALRNDIQARDDRQRRQLVECRELLAQANLALEKQVEQHRFTAGRLSSANRALRMLRQANQALIRSLDEPDLLRNMCHVVVTAGEYACAWTGYAQYDGQKTVRPMASEGCGDDYLTRLHVTWDDHASRPSGIAIRTGKPVIWRNIATDPTSACLRQEALELGYGAIAALPLVSGGHVIGVLSVHAERPDAFDDEELQWLVDLAGDFAFGITAMRIRTQRQRAVHALQMSEERYRQIVETAEEGILVLDNRDQTLFANQKMADLLGYPLKDLISRPVFDLVLREDVPRMTASLARRRRGAKESYDLRLCHRDGHEVWVIVSTAPIFDSRHEYAGTLKMITDITERKRLEREVAEIALREQQRIGRDLHDVLGQTLTGIAFLSKILEQKLGMRRLGEASDAAEICRLVNQSMRQTHALAQGLQPLTRQPDGLMRALEELAADTTGLFGVECRFDCPEPVLVDNQEAATHLHHIAQEAVSNAIKHGRARRIDIRLHCQDTELILTIENDGEPFPPEASASGLGLRIMRQRATAIGAILEIGPKSHSGTVVRCRATGIGLRGEVTFRHDHERDRQ